MTTRLPNRIYQYQSFNEYSLQNLKNSEIYFNSPLNFNDPYDCLHTVKYDELSIELLSNLHGKAMKNSELIGLTRRLLNFEISKPELILYFSLLYDNSVDKGNKNASGKSEYILQLTSALEDESNFKELNKQEIKKVTITSQKTVERTLNSFQNEMVHEHGVSCFTEINNDILMWAYYSQGHKGLCLEFDTSFDPFNDLKKVRYVNEAPVFNPSSLLDIENEQIYDDNFIETFLATKHQVWEREREWRLLHKKAGTKFRYDQKALTGIYFGSKMDSATREILITILKAQNPYVKFYKMEKRRQEFKVHPVEIYYSTPMEVQNLILSTLLDLFQDKPFALDDLKNEDRFNYISEDNLNIHINTLIERDILKNEDGQIRFNLNS
ncbi:DUF2971 domain-containing protein [Jiulongibacter sp. NS-SX5]|uniref:DUF2971 domain-containing protein n=1 Tax=Jiulongibacter sp. NS-SX5 TaxID=3463854 RepID=UPI004058EDA3